MFFDDGYAKAVMNRQYWLSYRTDGHGEHELYHLESDPLKLTNLYDDTRYFGVREKLQRDLLDWYINTEQPQCIPDNYRMAPESRWMKMHPYAGLLEPDGNRL